MKILVLGGDGMLGHQLVRHFSGSYSTKYTLRKSQTAYDAIPDINQSKAYFNTEITDIQRLQSILEEYLPDVVINCIGIVKQRKSAKESIPSIEINALMPHKLALMCDERGAKFIHVSTDCVFSGKKGNYKETDPADAEDLYGKTKYLGEVHNQNSITLRTSIIGHELSRNKSLLEWFLAQEDQVYGYKKAIYTGFTTNELARIIEMLLLNYPNANGLYQVSSDPINKFDLLQMFKKYYGKDVSILPDENFCNDKSLDSSRFREEFNYNPPTWDEMVRIMAEEFKQNSLHS